jgi:small conductance mechanosensitive channel
MDQHLQTLDKVKSTAIDMAMQFGPKLLVAILIIAAGVYAGGWVAKGMLRGLRRFELEPPVRDLLVRIVRILVVGLFAIMALQNLGVQLLPLIAGLGVAGAGVALATQGVLSNLVAGLTIIFTKPFRVGEYIALLGVEGNVQTISLFNITLGHPDQSRVVIPNRKIIGEILHNYGKIRQVDLLVGVTYDTDLNRALAEIKDVLLADPHVLKEPAPVIAVAVLADSSIDIAIKPWTSVPDFPLAAGEIYKAIVERFRERGIDMPFPQLEVRLLQNAP